MKMYIVGPPGSGKTTLAKKLSEEEKIPYYELDLIVFDDDNDHERRSDQEIKAMFDEIIKKEEWIIEDVGRSKFRKAFDLADVIYYLKFSKWQIRKRIFRRWKNQRKGIEKYNYPPTVSQLIDMFKVADSYFFKEKEKLELLKKYNNKVKYVSFKEIEKK